MSADKFATRVLRILTCASVRLGSKCLIMVSHSEMSSHLIPNVNCISRDPSNSSYHCNNCQPIADGVAKRLEKVADNVSKSNRLCRSGVLGPIISVNNLILQTSCKFMDSGRVAQWRKQSILLQGTSRWVWSARIECTDSRWDCLIIIVIVIVTNEQHIGSVITWQLTILQTYIPSSNEELSTSTPAPCKGNITGDTAGWSAFEFQPRLSDSIRARV